MDSDVFAGLIGILMLVAMILFGIVLMISTVLLPLFVWGIYNRMCRQNKDMESVLRELRGLKKQLEDGGVAKSTPRLSAKRPASARSASLPAIKQPETVRDLEMERPFEADEDDVEEEEGFECESCNFVGTAEDFTTADGLACPNCGQN